MGPTSAPASQAAFSTPVSGEMARAIRGRDWSATSLGAREGWPASLTTLSTLITGSAQPMFLVWGADGLFLYNDAFAPLLGGRHPQALGQPAREVWSSSWGAVEPLFAAAASGRGVLNGAFPLRLDGDQPSGAALVAVSCTPVFDGSEEALGVLGVCSPAAGAGEDEGLLEEARNQFDQLFEQSATFMAMLNAEDYTIERANPGYLALVGGRAVVGKTVPQALPEAVSQGFLQILDRVRDTGAPFSARAMRYAPDPGDARSAGERYLDFVYQPIKDRSGRVVRIFVEGADVTERARAEQGRAESEARLALALSGAEGVGVWDWDVAADRVVADEQFARLYDVDPALARVGAPIAAFLTAIHPEDLGALSAAIGRAVEAGGAFSAEYRILRPGRSPAWVRSQGWCVKGADGAPTRFPGVSFDITDRRTIEARQETLLRLTDALRDLKDPDAIAFAGSEILGRALDVSRIGYGVIDTVAETITIDRDWNAPGVRTIAGVLNFRDYGSYIEDLKRGVTVVIADAREDPRTQATAGALEGISAASFVNMPLVEQGRFVALFFANHAQPRRWSESDLVLMREVADRVRVATERARAEASLRRLNETLEQEVAARTAALMTTEEALRQSQKMEAVGQLTGGIAHDFNNLLAGINGSLELLGRRLAEGRVSGLERYIETAQACARRAVSLTQRLLAFSRRQTLDPRSVDVNRLISSMEELVRRTMGPDVEVEVVHAGGLWPTRVDPSQLENALLNLCINARDAMRPKGGRLTIETANKWLDARAAQERDLPPGQYISLCVTDTGSGMTPEIAARAFDPFFTTKPLGEGTGLGLSMIYGFVRQSGGQVRIYSEVGEGTTMCIYLPRHSGPVDEPSRELAYPLADAGDGHTVLVIDDEQTVRMLISEVLGEHGYVTVEAADGPSGLRILQSDAPIDLLITDVGLPGGLNGRQVADAARATRPDLKVLFITGYAENAVVGDGRLDRGMEVITKPFPMLELAAKVRELLDG